MFLKAFVSVFLLSLGLSSAQSLAADLEWSGTYRAEGLFLKNSEGSGGREKDYGLHHLILRPKIVASDNLTIYSQFHLFNNAGFQSSQLGQFFGSGPQSGTADSAFDSTTLSDQNRSESILISQLYLSMTQEFGNLVVGRVPLQFGLGMTHNAGNGLFDHWFDSRDIVGYKVIMGNLSFLPMIGKKHEGTLNSNDDVSSYMIQAQYDNYETNLSMGVFYEMNNANDQAPLGPSTTFPNADPAQTIGSAMSEKQWNVFVLKNTDEMRIGLEGSFQSGDVGLRDTNGQPIAWDGFGVAAEFEYRPKESLWKYGAMAGYASGDDPATTNTYEGYVFDRNYDIAFLMFNHQLGQADLLGTRGYGGGGRTLASGGNQQPDVEAVSNAMYFAPYSRYKWSDTWSIGAKVTAGYLVQNPLVGQDVAKDLGFELDLSLEYAPKEGIRWVNEFGYLFSGDALSAGNQFDNGNIYGVISKAAISF